MKIYSEHYFVKTKSRIEFLDITDKVNEIVEKSRIKEGLCLLNPMHITASVFINDAESGLLEDFKAWLEKLAPQKGN